VFDPDSVPASVEALQQASLTRRQLLQRVLHSCDSIVVLGAQCESTGLPGQNARARCNWALAFKSRMPSCEFTIFSGGSRGVPKAYLEQVDPTATEAGLMMKYCTEKGGDPTKYILEPYALETVGNVVFSTNLLLQYGLSQPVFLSQLWHLDDIAPVVWRWLLTGGITAEWWWVDSPDPERELEEFEREPQIDFGAAELQPLSSSGWIQNRGALRSAICWLFEKLPDRETGGSFYGRRYKLTEILDKLQLIGSKKAFPRGMPKTV